MKFVKLRKFMASYNKPKRQNKIDYSFEFDFLTILAISFCR